jgi:hypothetical protein
LVMPLRMLDPPPGSGGQKQKDVHGGCNNPFNNIALILQKEWSRQLCC